MTGSRHLDDLATELNDLARSLREAEERCRRATATIAPGVRFDQTVCERYAHALVNWPGREKPSYEQLALLLSHVNDAAHAVTAAAVHCADAWHVVDALGRPGGSADVRGGR